MSQIELASFQVSRRALPWMLASVVASILPHVSHLPWWLTAIALLCVAWRWGVHRGLISYPPKRLQFLFALLLTAGVYLHYRTFAGHVAGTAMLLAMYSLKLLEMYKERDAYVVILIGYFFAATAFLFHFDLLTACYVLFVALLFTATLVAINTSLSVPRSEPIKRAFVLFAQSVPLAIILFLVIPRIGPLWGGGLKAADAKTGVGEEMSPGTVGELALSDELAFRVDFEGTPPAPARLYWRGLTLSEFDGRTWRQSRLLTYNTGDAYSPLWYPGTQRPGWLRELASAARDQRAEIGYTVYLEATQRPWLFALSVPVDTGNDMSIGMVRDQRLRVRDAVKTLKRYHVTSVVGLPHDLELPRWLRMENLELPAGSGPRARQWALQQRAEAGDDPAYVRRVLTWIGDGSFAYTLQPPRLGAQPIDEFLFDSKHGFCEHYAGSFVFLMRAAGIPARVVAGYQGGKLNPFDNTIQVRQYDAHAWAEIWLAGRGWVEVDPTAYVSPARIESGQDALGAEREQLRGRSWGQTLLGDSFNALRDAVGYINHRWNSWVLGFDEQQQQGLLTRWLGEFSPYRIGLFVAGAGAAIVAVLALWMFGGSLFMRSDPVTREYLRFCSAWAARGHARHDGEGPFDYGERLRKADPRRANEVTRFIALYVQIAYGRSAPDAAALRRLRAARVTAV